MEMSQEIASGKSREGKRVQHQERRIMLSKVAMK